MLRFLTASLLITLSGASYCGESAIPYSVEILSDGQPVLGCSRPSCFGWTPSGKPAMESGSFYRINDHADGFIRNGRDSIPSYGPPDPRYYRSQTAVCDQSFTSSNCSGINQWVGGISPLLNVSAFPIVLQCCSFDGLLQSEDRGLASLRGGQIVVGGEVMSSGLQIGFDYISDVIKFVHADGSLHYDVSIRRMPCADVLEPEGLFKIPKPFAAAQAFQEPNVVVDQPLPLPTQNVVLEEVVQVEGIQLPPGTQFQPVPPPPPPQPPVAFQAPSFVPQAVPQSYSPPASYYSGGSGGNDNGLWCFTADMTVELADGTTKRMDELNRMDWVLSANEDELEFVQVDYWMHRIPDQEAEFNEFEMEDGRTIKLTDKHYIYKGECSGPSAATVSFSSLPQHAVTAEQVRTGDCLYVLGENRLMTEVRVVRSDKVTQKGIYAPMTSKGRIIVNGVHASCHNIMQEHSIGHTVFGFVHNMYRFYSKIFGFSEEVVEVPIGLSTILDMAHLIVPINIVTF